MAQTVQSSAKTSTIETQPDVELRQVVKIFGSDTAVRQLDLAIRQGEFFSILGPSGCGKTTTLRLVAGFEAPTAGEVLIQGTNVSTVPAHRRPVNTVFQSYALFDHMSVKDNIAFGLKIRRLGAAQVRDRVADALRLVRMETMASRYPAQLSGGQQQRVALARALVNRPAVMLLDEPLGALDQKLRKQMQVELANLHRQLGITFVMVTHDQEEALSLSDRIAVMNNGQIEQIGSPSDIYDRPRTPFVADFIGDTNLLPGRVEQADPAQVQITTESGLRVLARTAGSSPSLRDVVVSIRPEKITLSPTPGVGGNCYRGQVSHLMYLGTHRHYVIHLSSGEALTVRRPNQSEDSLAIDSSVYVSWTADDCLVLDAV
ncbi:MAG: ABC transporter ATP-binding protein [Nodosilinea sp.]